MLLKVRWVSVHLFLLRASYCYFIVCCAVKVIVVLLRRAVLIRDKKGTDRVED